MVSCVWALPLLLVVVADSTRPFALMTSLEPTSAVLVRLTLFRIFTFEPPLILIPSPLVEPHDRNPCTRLTVETAPGITVREVLAATGARLLVDEGVEAPAR